MLLLGSTREQASIEFGAQQVILVRSQEAKNGLEDLRRGALVCTVPLPRPFLTEPQSSRRSCPL